MVAPQISGARFVTGTLQHAPEPLYPAGRFHQAGGKLVSHARTEPPTSWCGGEELTRLTDDLYYGWPPGSVMPRFWHWCTAIDRWVSAGTGSHTLVTRHPLHLEPSLLWSCCRLHGFVRDGTWTPA